MAKDEKSWHLARSEGEQQLADFEFSLERIMRAFYRWKSECLAAVSDGSFTGDDAAVLNIIRYMDRPKGLSEIAGLLNRADTANIQYTLRKLLKAGLIEKTNAVSRRATGYQVSAEGRRVTEEYADLRAELLVSLTRALGSDASRFGEAAGFLDLLAGLYDQATARASTKRYVLDAAE